MMESADISADEEYTVHGVADIKISLIHDLRNIKLNPLLIGTEGLTF